MLSLSEVPTNFEVQYPSDLGPDADIHEVPRYKEPLYPCINDLSEGGTCSSGEKVFQPDALCIRCESLRRSSGCGLQDAQLQIILGFDPNIHEVPYNQYDCVNKQYGTCNSGIKVYQAKSKCTECIKEKRSPGCETEVVPCEVALGLDAGIIEVPSPASAGYLCGEDCTGNGKVPT